MRVAGVRISHPDRQLYPDTGITKHRLAQFYERIGDWILPRLAGRPLTLVRCPTGIAGGCHYMKHSEVWAPPAVRRVMIPEKTKTGECLVVDGMPALVSLVQSMAAFSTRARPGAPVSVPLRREDVTPKLNPAGLTVLTIERRLAKSRRDPWADYWTTRQRLSPSLTEAVSWV